MVTVVVSAATAWPAAVVNDGQLIASVPAPGCPFARYTVPCTVVVLTACAIAVAVSTIASEHTAILRTIRNRSSFMSFIPIASFFSLQFANSIRWGRPQRIGLPHSGSAVTVS